jgi:hypothetical protein
MEAGKTWSEVKRLAVDRTGGGISHVPYAPDGTTGIKKTDNSAVQIFISVNIKSLLRTFLEIYTLLYHFPSII